MLDWNFFAGSKQRNPPCCSNLSTRRKIIPL